jgi:hypothetical protein
MGFWKKLFGNDSDAQYKKTLKDLGMPNNVLELHLKFEKNKKEFLQGLSCSGKSPESQRGAVPSVHGAPVGQIFSCEVCGAKMEKLGAGKGRIMMSREEMMMSVGPAEECYFCGRAYCGTCYPSRPKVCICGQGEGSVTEVEGVIYQGPLRLIKVRYL